MRAITYRTTRARLAIALLCSSIVLPLGTLALAQPSLRVRATTRIDVRAERSENTVRIVGALHDDLGLPIAHAAVQLRLEALVDTAAVGSRSVRVTSDAQGDFSSAFELPAARYRVHVVYDGDAFYQGGDVATELDPALLDVTLQFVSPRSRRLPLEAASHDIAVHAFSGDSPAPELAITLSDELRRTLASGNTDERGDFHASVLTSALAGPGAGKLIVSSAATSRYAGSRAELIIVRLAATSLQLTVDANPEAHTLRASGSLRSAPGKADQIDRLDHKAIGLFIDATHVASVLTDARGNFTRELEWPRAARDQTHYVQARFESDAPWLTSSRSKAIALTIDAETPSELWLLVPTLLSLALALRVLRSSRPTSAPSASVPERRAGVSLGAASAARAQLYAISGNVDDVETRMPLAHAQLAVRDPDGNVTAIALDADARFTWLGSARGLHELSVSADGYETERTSLRLPHAGQGQDIRVSLASLRAVAAALFEPVVARIAPQAGHHMRTAREALQARQQAEHHSPANDAELTSLANEVELATYAHASPTQDAIAEISAHSDVVMHALDQEHDGSRAPKRER